MKTVDLYSVRQLCSLMSAHLDAGSRQLAKKTDLGIGHSTIDKYRMRLKQAGTEPEDVPALDDETLAALLGIVSRKADFIEPDMDKVRES